MPASASIFDFDQLLAPISPDKPCGESMRYEPVWDELKQSRLTRIDPVHPSGNKLPEWDQVERIAVDLLATKTKDLLLAGWLTEAALRRHGFAGLRDGLKLITGLVERFWGAVYPLPDGADLSNRLAPLTWLTSDNSGMRMAAAVREVPLAPSGEQVFNWNFWHLRRTSPQMKDEKEADFKKRSGEAEKNKQAFDLAVDTAPIAFFQTLLADIDASVVEIDVLQKKLDAQLAENSPSWTSILSSISDIRSYVDGVYRRRGGYPADQTEKATDDAPHSASETNGSSGSRNGPIGSRADAIARLEEVARFFSETEPHSPVSYLVRRSIRWAGMPFDEVLGELVKDDKLVKQIGETLGIVSGPSK